MHKWMGVLVVGMMMMAGCSTAPTKAKDLFVSYQFKNKDGGLGAGYILLENVKVIGGKELMEITEFIREKNDAGQVVIINWRRMEKDERNKSEDDQEGSVRR